MASPRADYSPSRAHARLLRRPPALAWRGEPVGPWQRKLRQAMATLLGLDAMSETGARFDARVLAATPPRARTLWQRAWRDETGRELGTLRKVELALELGARAPAYLCLPPGAPPTHFVVCLQGHTTGMHNSIGLAADETTPIVVPGDRDFAVHCVRRGFGALALEQRSLGERRESLQARKSFHNDCHDAAMRALLVGRTLLGERVHDVIRAASWLRAVVGARSIGVLGNSGGGTVATMAAAMDPALDFVVASCSFASLAASIGSIHHCSDNYVPRMLTIADAGDVGGLVAPRPLVILAGREDPIFPTAAVRAAHAGARRIYAAVEATDRVRLVVEPGGHRFYAQAAFDALRDVMKAARTRSARRARRGSGVSS